MYTSTYERIFVRQSGHCGLKEWNSSIEHGEHRQMWLHGCKRTDFSLSKQTQQRSRSPCVDSSPESSGGDTGPRRCDAGRTLRLLVSRTGKDKIKLKKSINGANKSCKVLNMTFNCGNKSRTSARKKTYAYGASVCHNARHKRVTESRLKNTMTANATDTTSKKTMKDAKGW